MPRTPALLERRSVVSTSVLATSGVARRLPGARRETPVMARAKQVPRDRTVCQGLLARLKGIAILEAGSDSKKTATQYQLLMETWVTVQKVLERDFRRPEVIDKKVAA